MVLRGDLCYLEERIRRPFGDGARSTLRDARIVKDARSHDTEPASNPYRKTALVDSFAAHAEQRHVLRPLCVDISNREPVQEETASRRNRNEVRAALRVRRQLSSKE